MEGVEFRQASAGDCRAVWELICDMEQTELPYDAFSDVFERQRANPQFYCLLADATGTVAGVLNMRIEGQLHHAGPVAEIMEFAVAGPWRRCGLGHELFAGACRIAKENGCPQLELACNKLRLDAHRFYRREGMHDHHYKFSIDFRGGNAENRLGR